MLSLRLQTLAGYHHDSHVIYDIGCDHAQLGLSFKDHPQVSEIYLVDPSLQVIKTLNQYLTDAYITIPDSIKVLHQKGQELILKSKSKTVFIAGMGGKEIQEIIQNLKNQLTEFDRLVISPHRNILDLRKYLHDSEFRLVDEVSVKEEGQFYQILCLSLDQSYGKVHPYGEKIWQGIVGSDYRQSQMKHFSRHQDLQSVAYTRFLDTLN